MGGCNIVVRKSVIESRVWSNYMFTGWDELKIDRKPWSLAGFLQISLKNLGYVSDMQEVNLT